jgi:putative transposase
LPMPQSYTSLHYHIVFSTKRREPTIAVEVRPRLYEYLGGLIRGEGGSLMAIGGIADHIHLLVRLRPDRAISDVLRVVKTNSSRWAHAEFAGLPLLWWQSGSGMFTVSKSLIPAVTAYIENQEEHHRATTFQDEFRGYLIDEDIEFNEEYLWGD